MTDKFDKATKLGFRDPEDPQYIRFGSVRDKDPDLGIKAGKLRLDGWAPFLSDTNLAHFLTKS